MPVNPESVIYKEINEFTLKPLIDGLEKIQITREFATTLKAISDFVNNYYNVTHLHPLGSGYYTSTTARAAIPTNVKRRGLVITFETSDGVWSKEQFRGNPATEWATAGKWKTLPGDTLQDVGTSTIDTLSQNAISLFFDRQVKDYNSSYVFKGFCVANQAAPSTPSANDVYLYTGSVTATVFGIANVPAKNYLVYSGTAWTTLNPYIPKVQQSRGTSVSDTMSQKSITDELVQLAADEAAMVPSIAQYKRIIADSGLVRDKTLLFDSLLKSLNQSTILQYSPEMGLKQSVSGVVYKASKLYDMSANNNDASQATAGSQPYIVNNIAPNERAGLLGLGKTMTFTPISFSATDKWSVVVVSDIYGTYTFVRSPNTFITNDTFRNESNTSVAFTKGLAKNITQRIYFIAKGDGTLQIWVNGLLIEVVTNPTNVLFNTIGNVNTASSQGKLKSIRILNKDLSKSEIESIDNFLKVAYPDIDGTAIGSQYWATSNAMISVTGDGTAIPEVQGNDAASNTELVINGSFETSNIGNVSNEVGGAVLTYATNTISPISGTQDARLIITNAGTSNLRPYIAVYGGLSITANKVYRIVFKYKVNSGVVILNRLMIGGNSNLVVNTTLSGSGTFTGYIAAKDTIPTGFCGLNFDGRNTLDIQIDDVSMRECGWADSQAIYDYYISIGQSALEATKAAAMWCKYNNSDDNAAVYGYLLNKYAVSLIGLNAPKGWRAVTYADALQLANNLSLSVSGKKLKLSGTNYWTTPNSGTNESGFSALGSGKRNADGTFSALGTEYNFRTLDGYLCTITNSGDGITFTASADSRIGGSLRLLRNAPVAESNRITRTTGVFNTDIVSGAKSIEIPFGFSVASILISTSTNVTNIEAKLFDFSGTEKALLLTQKICNNDKLIFQVLPDQPTLYQNGTVRVTAKGNSGDGMEIVVVLDQVLL